MRTTPMKSTTKTNMKITKFLTLLALCGFAPATFAQSQAEQEIAELFRRVEKRLVAIDQLLSDASTNAGSTSTLKDVGASGIDELLKSSREQSAEVIEAIDRILEISAEQQSSSSSSSSGEEPSPQPGSSQPGGSPLDRGQQTTPREQTPEAGGDKPKDMPGGNEPKPDKPGPKPEDGGATEDPEPKNLQLGASNATPQGAPSDTKGLERWGALPQHAQNVFRSEGGTELPAQYRDWIDAYHRRLNRESGRQ